MLGNLGFGEILIILVLILVLFGPDKIPELARTIGRWLYNFRRQMDEAQRSVIDPLRREITPLGGYTPPPDPQIGSGFAPPSTPPELTEEEERARQPKRLLE